MPPTPHTRYPEWIAPPLPWELHPPVTVEAPTADVPPSPAPAARRPRGFVAVAAAAVIALIAGFLAFGGRVTTHGARPTTAESPSTTLQPLMPTFPAAPPAGSAETPDNGGLTDAEVNAVADRVRPGVVDIDTVVDFGRGAGAGTGLILTSDGEILTNNHVVNNATSIRVTVVATGRVYTAKVVGTVPTEDVALLKIQANGLTPIAVGDSDAVTPGDPVVAIGNAGGRGGDPTVVAGLVQAVNETITASDDARGTDAQTLHGLIEHDAAIEPGDSGGPLATRDGKVVGMNSAASVAGRFGGRTTAGYAIPINHALGLISRVKTGEASDLVHQGLPGFLGVQLAPSLGFSDGVEIDSVSSGLPAARAGITPGSTITAIGGVDVHTGDELSAAIRSHRAGARIEVRWTDANGQARSATLTLAAGPAD